MVTLKTNPIQSIGIELGWVETILLDQIKKRVLIHLYKLIQEISTNYTVKPNISISS